MSNLSQITAEGDLVIHNLGGFTTTLEFKDDAEAPRNMSARTVKFLTSAGHSIPLTNGGTTDKKILTITQGALDTAIGVASNFAVVDETSTPHTIHWAGRLFVVGW